MRCLKVPMRCVRVGTFFVGGWGGLNHAWNYLGVLVLTQITGDVRIALSISVWGMRWISWLRLANGCGLWI